MGQFHYSQQHPKTMLCSGGANVDEHSEQASWRYLAFVKKTMEHDNIYTPIYRLQIYGQQIFYNIINVYNYIYNMIYLI